MRRHLIIAVAIIVAVVSVATYLLLLRPQQSGGCIAKDNTLIVVYLKVPPNEQAYNVIAESLSYAIRTNSSNRVSINLTTCFIKYQELDEKLRKILSNVTAFPVIVVYTHANLFEAPTAQQLFDYSEGYYILKEMWATRILATLVNYGIAPYQDTAIFSETMKEPLVLPNETPVIGSPTAKYYLIIYEDAYCPYCARFYVDSLPSIEEKVRDGTIALVLKNFVVHSDAWIIHRNITAMYIATRNATAVLNIMKNIYSLINRGIHPSPDYVKELIRNVTGYESFNVNIDDVEKVMLKDGEEGASYRIFGTPGFVIWSKEKNYGVIIVGLVSADNIFSIINRWL
jgi:thioredoxin-related protein